MNLRGEVINGRLEELLENDLKEMNDYPNHKDELLTTFVDLKHSFIITQNRVFTRVLDMLNLYISKSKYELTKEEENDVRENFIKYAKLLIETNQKAIDKLFKGREVSGSELVKLYDKDILLDLINRADKKDRVNLQSFLISPYKYYDLFGSRLEDEYQKYNNDILNSIMTFAEATERWGLADSTLRKLVTTDKLQEGVDYRKSGKVWLITKEAMKRIYGEPK